MLQVRPGDHVVRLVGLPAYEKGFCYQIASVDPEWDRITLEGYDGSYTMAGRANGSDDASYIVPIAEVPDGLRNHVK